MITDISVKKHVPIISSEKERSLLRSCHLILWMPYEFPVAAVTNDHEPGGLQQPRLVLSQFWRSEV